MQKLKNLHILKFYIILFDLFFSIYIMKTKTYLKKKKKKKKI